MYPSSNLESLLGEECLVFVYRMYACTVAYFLNMTMLMLFFCIFPIADVCCSSTFWWKVEFLFASLSQEDESFLKQQVRATIFYYTANTSSSQFH